MARPFKPYKPPVDEITLTAEMFIGKETKIQNRDVVCKKCGNKFISDFAKCFESDNPDRVYCECTNSECKCINHILKVRVFA